MEKKFSDVTSDGFQLLDCRLPHTISEYAEVFGFPNATSFSLFLRENCIITVDYTDEEVKRRRYISFTEKGEKLLKQLIQDVIRTKENTSKKVKGKVSDVVNDQIRHRVEAVSRKMLEKKLDATNIAPEKIHILWTQAILEHADWFTSRLIGNTLCYQLLTTKAVDFNNFLEQNKESEESPEAVDFFKNHSTEINGAIEVIAGYNRSDFIKKVWYRKSMVLDFWRSRICSNRSWFEAKWKITSHPSEEEQFRPKGSVVISYISTQYWNEILESLRKYEEFTTKKIERSLATKRNQFSKNPEA